MDKKTEAVSNASVAPGSVFEVFRAFAVLGLTSFGGPVAHIGYFREAFVVKRKWISDAAYADLVALCQFLPGPASSQVGMAIGLQRAGFLGLLAAWIAFTLPSAILLVAFAYGLSMLGSESHTGWIDGFKAAAVAVVAHAVLGMASSLTPDRERATMAALAMILALLFPTASGQVLAILVGAAIGIAWLTPQNTQFSLFETLHVPLRRRTGAGLLVLFLVLLVGLPLAASSTGEPVIAMIDGFYRAGALVFGGGHVVLPLLQTEVVATGHVTEEAFLAGYGAAQAVPGPLFAFAAFLGAAYQTYPSGITGAVIALAAIYIPSGLLVAGTLPFWEKLRFIPLARRAMLGINASVVGLLAAALYDPVFTAGITSPMSMAIAAASFIALVSWRIPAWAIVLASGVLGALLL